MINIQELSTVELQKLITDAQAELETKQNGMRKDVIAQIKELASSINVTVEIIEDKKSKKTKSFVPAKYANPNNPSDTWTGRGLAPKWMQALIAEGRSKDEFLIR